MGRTRFLAGLLAAGLLWTGAPPAEADAAGTGTASGLMNFSPALDFTTSSGHSFNLTATSAYLTVASPVGTYSGFVSVTGSGSVFGMAVKEGHIGLTMSGTSVAARAEDGLLSFSAECRSTADGGVLSGVVVVAAGVKLSVKCTVTIKSLFGPATFNVCLKAAAGAVAVALPITSLAFVAGIIVYPC